MTRVSLGLGIAFAGLVTVALVLVANGGLSVSVSTGLGMIGYLILGVAAIAGILWLLSRVLPTATAAVGSMSRVLPWLTALVLIVLVLVFWDTLMALFPAGTQVRLAAFRDALLNNWVLALLIIAAFLLLLKQRTAAIVVAAVAVLAFFLMPDTSGLSRSERFYTWITTPAPRIVPATREVVLPPNTSRDCPGKLLGPFRLDTAEVQFNPKGCYFYALGSGTVKFTGLYMGDLTVDLRTGAGDSPAHSKVYAARAAYAPVEWQYILCSGPKKDMSTMDCR